MLRAMLAAVAYLVCLVAFAVYYLGLCRADARQHDQQHAIERRDAEQRHPRVESQSTTLARFMQ